MDIAPGTMLGPYRIVGPLGAGGMGEVFRAHDTRLERDVAIKVLPERFASRTDVRARFEREARAISRLNHPHICTLYDVGSHDGAAYLVMELIDGQSLANRLRRGPLPLPQVLQYGAEIADALAKAHRHGIVHRDLKPGNVMITRSGAKLLDFGLALRSAPSSEPADVTTTEPITADGILVGTIRYMAPEVFEGKEADSRSDIFALGAVLYEMTTGRRAFDGENQASVMMRIMTQEPPPLAETQPITPSALEHLIRACVAKDPEQRWQCAADVASELRWIATSVTEAPETETAKRRRRLPWSIAFAVLALVAMGLAALALRSPSPPPVLRFNIGPPVKSEVIVDDTLWSPVAVSPDGLRVAFVTNDGQRQLWVRTLSEAVAKPVAGSAGALAPFWSPDGKSLAFFSSADAGAKLRIVKLDSGSVQTVCDIIASAAPSGTWSPDGTIVFTQSLVDDGIFRVPSGGGTAQRFVALPPGVSANFPRFLPDGKRFFVTGAEKNGTGLWMASTDGAKPMLVAGGLGRVDYVKPYLIYARDGSILAQRFDEKNLQLTGPTVPIASDARVYSPNGFSAHAASDRTLALLPYARTSKLVWYDRTGRASPTPPLPRPADLEQVRISPDGRRIATTIVDPHSGTKDIWTLDLAADPAKATTTRITFGDTDYGWPAWSPGGDKLVFNAERDGAPHLFTADAGGGSPPQQLLPATAWQIPFDWSAKGVMYGEIVPKRRFDLKLLANGQSSTWLGTPFNDSMGRVSPDGRWVAYISRDSQESGDELFVRSFDRTGERIRISNAVSEQPPVWRGDGRELFYLSPDNELFAVPITANGNTLTAGEPVRLFALPAEAGDFDATADGKRFLVRVDDRSLPPALRVVMNWKAEVEGELARK